MERGEQDRGYTVERRPDGGFNFLIHRTVDLRTAAKCARCGRVLCSHTDAEFKGS